MAKKSVHKTGTPKAVIIFTDIRGFTSWSHDVEVFDELSEFVKKFMALVKKTFSGFKVKGLGDGAMIVKELENLKDFGKLLNEVLDSISQVNEKFQTLSQSFADRIGHKTELALGWGVVRGPVKRIAANDYVSSSVNKCARLCDAARPFGVVVDRDDFSARPEHLEFTFHKQSLKLSGYSDEVDVWVTNEIFSQFIPRERLREMPEVHVAGMCIDENYKDGIRVFVARRNENREHYGGLLEGCGGQLRNRESFEDGVKRHFKTELHIEVNVNKSIHCFYEIDETNHDYIPGIRFLCIKISEDSDWKSLSHSEVKWLKEEELRDMPQEQFIPGLKSDFLTLIDQYHESK